MGRQSRRPLQRRFTFLVGADDSVRPQNIPLFTEIFGEFATSQRADVGIGPYKVLCRFVTVRRAKQSPSPTESRKREATQMKKFLNEFKTFISRGNVMDMAIGVVIGAAFGKITTSIVNDIIMPLIGLVTGGIDLTQWNILLNSAAVEAGADPVTLGIGNLLAVILDFIIVAFAMFLLVKAMNKLASLKKKEEEAPEEDPEPTSEELLTEIRDLLKAQQK